MNSTMIKVCFSLLLLQLLTSALENPAHEENLKSDLMDDSSLLGEICSPEQRSKILEVMTTASRDLSLRKRSLIDNDADDIRLARRQTAHDIAAFILVTSLSPLITSYLEHSFLLRG